MRAMREDILDVELTRAFFLLLVIAAIGSLGVLAALLYLIAMWYPRRLDREGIVTRGGRRHAWSDFVEVVPRRNGSFQLRFRTGRVIVAASFVEPTSGIHDHLRRHGIDPTTTSVR
jgi:hypothetical protein